MVFSHQVSFIIIIIIIVIVIVVVIVIIIIIINNNGVRGSVVVKTLCYKPEDRGFDSR
jgi:hypothetical protein